MDEAVHSGSVWKLRHNRAELRCGPFIRGDVDVLHPQAGLHRLKIGDVALPGQILGVRPDMDAATSSPLDDSQSQDVHERSGVDCYVRGSDLVATYPPRDNWPFTTQVYWSAVPIKQATPALGSLSLFVSLQTQLLDTWPRLSVVSQLAADEVMLLVANSTDDVAVKLLQHEEHVLDSSGQTCCLIQRLAGAALSYTEAMPASDFRQLTIRHAVDGTCERSWELFADFLEKGVIRRARMQAAFLPREDDIARAAAWSSAIDQQRLPLTT